jgi:hypothetical protein
MFKPAITKGHPNIYFTQVSYTPRKGLTYITDIFWLLNLRPSNE